MHFYIKFIKLQINKTFVVLKKCIKLCIVSVAILRLPTNYANKRTNCRTYFTLCFTSSFLRPFSPFFLSLFLSFRHHKLLKQLSFNQALTFALFSSIPIFFHIRSFGLIFFGSKSFYLSREEVSGKSHATVFCSIIKMLRFDWNKCSSNEDQASEGGKIRKLDLATQLLLVNY